MSDLAPFLASVLRDKGVADLKKENENQAGSISALKSSIRDLSSVFVTGPGGSPVYCKWNLAIDATELGWDGMLNSRCGEADTMRSMSAQDLLTAEI
jgi:hypothetical protein